MIMSPQQAGRQSKVRLVGLAAQRNGRLRCYFEAMEVVVVVISSLLVRDRVCG
jgi:hypothetical protein